MYCHSVQKNILFNARRVVL